MPIASPKNLIGCHMFNTDSSTSILSLLGFYALWILGVINVPKFVQCVYLNSMHNITHRYTLQHTRPYAIEFQNLTTFILSNWYDNRQIGMATLYKVVCQLNFIILHLSYVKSIILQHNHTK